MHYQPFENVRFELPNESGEILQVAIHPDWGRRNQTIKRFKKDDIERIDIYNPNPEFIAERVEEAGGWSFYKGQIFLFFQIKEPTSTHSPIFDNALTDMNTEEGISNILNRNAQQFLPAGMACRTLTTMTKQPTRMNTPKNPSRTIKAIAKALKLIYIQVNSKEEIPVFVPFKSNNYDKEFTVSHDTVKDSIGRSFNQPPILRAENVGAGFGADLMEQAYNYYNSVTGKRTPGPRANICRTF